MSKEPRIFFCFPLLVLIKNNRNVEAFNLRDLVAKIIIHLYAYGSQHTYKKFIDSKYNLLTILID